MASDRELGMDRSITRRDFVQGAGATVALGLLGPGGSSGEDARSPSPAYPPAREGLRGSHPGAFEVAHEMALAGRSDWGDVHEADPDAYDLVVVGGGVSGLSAAYFYRHAHPDARVLVLENHDDFGGHAKRNELHMGDRTVIGYGGSQSMEAPGSYSDVATGLLRDLGVRTERLEEAFLHDHFRARDMEMAIYFDRDRYGTDRLVGGPFVDATPFLPVALSQRSMDEAVGEMPISPEARRQLAGLFAGGRDVLTESSIFGEPELLSKISYRDFLTRHAGITEPQVIELLQDIPSGYFGVGIDAVPALEALAFGLPGLSSTDLGRLAWLLECAKKTLLEPYVYHFPDGNASIARLLVSRLIPTVAPPADMESVVSAPFDYARLDEAASPVRIRLASTVVRVMHDGPLKHAKAVDITYVRKGRTEAVRARHCVLACWNAVIPHLMPELPSGQREALAKQVKVPLVYTNVLLRSWRAAEKLRLAAAHCPGRFHKLVMLDFPVSLGDVQFSKTPDDPIVMHMSSALTSPGLPPREQHRAGRAVLLGMTFGDFEREIRTHLGGMLGAGGFDPARDIAAITVNRWPHGYAYAHNPLFDPDVPEDERLNVIGRQRFGRISIANSDAGGRAYLDCAIDEAHRAVTELA